MRGYFDTSLVLAIIQKEAVMEQALRIWEMSEQRCSSLLMRIEASLSIVRNITSTRNPDLKMLEQKEFDLRRMLSGTSLVPVDARISEIVERERRLVHCRSLDAIHLATALHLQAEIGEPLIVCSYDIRMRETAHELGFEVLPKKL